MIWEREQGEYLEWVGRKTEKERINVVSYFIILKIKRKNQIGFLHSLKNT